MPSPAADASKEHLKFDSSLTGNGVKLGLEWLQCNYEQGAYQQFTTRIGGLVIRLIKLGNIQCYWTNAHTNYRFVLPERLKDDHSRLQFPRSGMNLYSLSVCVRVSIN